MRIWLLMMCQGAANAQRINAGIVDKGANEAALMCVDEMKSTYRHFSASHWANKITKIRPSYLAQQRKGDTVNFAYIDNIARD